MEAPIGQGGHVTTLGCSVICVDRHAAFYRDQPSMNLTVSHILNGQIKESVCLSVFFLAPPANQGRSSHETTRRTSTRRPPSCMTPWNTALRSFIYAKRSGIAPWIYFFTTDLFKQKNLDQTKTQTTRPTHTEITHTHKHTHARVLCFPFRNQYVFV